MKAIARTPTLVRGGRCSCNARRVVRWAIPPMPGIPAGEVACRFDEEPAKPNTHEFPTGHVACVLMPVGGPSGAS